MCSCSLGHLTLTVDRGVYRVEMRHENARFEEDVNGSESVWICVLAQEQSLCMNISRSFVAHGQNGLHAQLTHSIPWLLSAGTLTSIFLVISYSVVESVQWDRWGLVFFLFFFFFLPTLIMVHHAQGQID